MKRIGELNMFKKKTAEEIGLDAVVISCEKCKHNNRFFYLDNNMYQGAYCDFCFNPILCNIMENIALSKMFRLDFKMDDLDNINSEFFKSIPLCPYCNMKKYTRMIHTTLREPLNCFKCGNELDKRSRKPILDLSEMEFYWYIDEW